MGRALSGVFLLGLVVCAGEVRAQVSAEGRPPRDPRERAATGTAVLAGRVVDGATGAPLARARVGFEGPAGMKSVLTDAEGRFRLAHLPAGSCFLHVSKPNYSQTRYPEEGRTLRSSMNALVLADGQTLDSITVPLHRTGAIAGNVVDANGEPPDSVEIRLVRLSPPNNGIAAAMTANDLGEFRFGRLAPGRYLLLAQPRLRSPDEPDEVQPVPTFYPGVTAPGQAQVITVERGQSKTGLDWVIAETVPTVVQGILVNAAGEPQSGGYVTSRSTVPGIPGGWGGGGVSARPDGTFEMRLAPGEYQLEGRVHRPQKMGEFRPEDQLVGMARVSAAGGTVSGVTIVIDRPGTISGTFVFDGAKPLPTEPNHLRGWGLSSREGECRSGRTVVTQSGNEWTFTVADVWGTCTLSAYGAPPGWTIKSVTHGDRDLLDRPFTIEPGSDLRDVKITYTDRRTSLALQVIDDAGQPTAEYAAVVFSTEKDDWTPESRRVRSYAPRPEPFRGSAPRSSPRIVPGIPGPERAAGRVVLDLPEGDYYVVVLDDLESDAARDPTILELLIRDASRVTLTEGVSTPLSVRRVVRRPR